MLRNTNEIVHWRRLESREFFFVQIARLVLTLQTWCKIEERVFVNFFYICRFMNEIRMKFRFAEILSESFAVSGDTA